MSSVDELVVEIVGDRSLSVVDRLAVEAFAVLVAELRSAKTSESTAEGSRVDVIAKCSREMRGWVERRPDLFGSGAAPARVSGRAKFMQAV